MKKMFLMLFAAFGTVGILNAQQGFPRRTVEERVKIIHSKLDSAFKLDPAKLTQTDTIFANYYRSSDKTREELMSGGQRPDFSVIREKMQPFVDARDKDLKTILTDDQFKTWKEQIEPSMRPQRPQNGGNRN
jgi:protein CpxP